ncbi:MAG: lysophospholipid acyltransferase family protein [bacterium]
MKNIFNFLVLNFLPVAINLYIKTLRIKINNLPADNSNGIYIFWHKKMLIGWWLFRDTHAAALVSQSKDGEILSSLLLNWNYNVIRGSSSKGGKEALEKIISLVKQNKSTVITPDGPRGPVNEMKNGAFIISHKCVVPLIPVKITYKKKIILKKSWDKFEIPLPFSNCEVVFGSKVFYEKYLGDKELEQLKQKISDEM